MEHELSAATGWMPTGYQAMVSLAIWIGVTVTHALWRSVADLPGPEKPR